MAGFGGGRAGMGGFGKKKSSLGREEEAEEVFVPEKGDQAGILLYELRSHILALPAGQELYRDLLKLLSLVTACVLTPDDVASVLHDKMCSGTPQLKTTWVHFKALIKAKPWEYPAVSELDLTSSLKVAPHPASPSPHLARPHLASPTLTSPRPRPHLTRLECLL